MDTNTFENGRNRNNSGPSMARVDKELAALEATEDDPEFLRRAEQGAGAVGFVHFDPSSASSNMVEALVHSNDLTKVHRGLYVNIQSLKDGRHYMGRVVEGPFYGPDALRRDSTPIQFIILNQGQGKALSLPEYHGWMQVELLGEERSGVLVGANRRPHPASPIFPFDATLMRDMLHLGGNIRLGLLDDYEDVFVEIDGNDKGVVPRNWMTVGTIGSGKSNTDQVFIEETLDAGYAQVVLDPEGEYVFMDQASDAPGVADDLAAYGREPRGVLSLTVYRPPLAESKRPDAREFSVPFESLSADLVAELTEMSPAQQTRFPFLYEQSIQLLRKEAEANGQRQAVVAREDLDLSRGYPGITLAMLIRMVSEEVDYYEHSKLASKANKSVSPGGGRSTRRAARQVEPDAEENEPEQEAEEKMEIYCHRYNLKPLINDYQDLISYKALLKKLHELRMTRIFDRPNVPPLNMEELSQPGHLTVLDMSDSQDQQVVNIVIADLLARMYLYKMALTEEQNAARKVFITIEEAHGFVSRDRKDKMQQTLDQLRRIARRGRKRWLALHFISQSPQHLPPELFELANNKIIHQTTGSENLRVLKAAAGSVNEGIWNDVPSLGKGRAVIVSSQYPHPIIAHVRPAASKRNYMV